MADKQKDHITGVEDTGHEWDGIRELNNPLPKWWLYVLYACILWSIGYWIAMPAWPMVSDYTRGLLGYDRRALVAEELVAARAERQVFVEKLLNASEDEINNSPELQQFALAGGRTLFADNCAGCHGNAAAGMAGRYPSLIDDDWLWDGTLEGIEQTLFYGIRADHDETRFNEMMAYGESEAGADDGILTNGEIDLLASWLAGESDENEQVATLFEENCSACHGEDGRGIADMGAPNLMDAIWLYGGDKGSITETLVKGRAGVMPAWIDRLSLGEIRVLATYVHAQGGGQ
ncbi:MAG: cytochrome-c oxidase, cbb3-type subunit III [Alphaproteobacteria bacterium]